MGKEKDGQRLVVNGRKGVRQQGSQARVYNGQTLVRGLFLTHSLKYMVQWFMHCRGFPVSFHSCSERGEEPSLGFAAITAWAGLDCSWRAMSCPETAVNKLCPTCLSFIPPSHPVLVFVLSATSGNSLTFSTC